MQRHTMTEIVNYNEAPPWNGQQKLPGVGGGGGGGGTTTKKK